MSKINLNMYLESVLNTNNKHCLMVDESELANITEGIIRVPVINNGVRKIVLKSDREGYAIKKIEGRYVEVPLSNKESKTRTDAQLKGAEKRKSTMQSSQNKRARSLQQRDKL